jgi:hypothetical protein
MKTWQTLWVWAAIAVLSLSGCKKEFDEPPGFGEDPAGVSANITIAALKALYSGTFLPITDNLIIEGIVVADDKSGNFYKSIVIQDATGGILIKIDATELYNEYPIGRRIFVKCQGLVLGDFNKLIQLGIGTDNTDPASPVLISIPFYQKDRFILKGKYGITVDPVEVSITELDDSYQNMLIRINNVEFTDSDADMFFADAINKVSINRRLKDCFNNEIILRSSGYADFANTKTPVTRGSIIAIYSVFRNDKQLYLRNLNDVAGMTLPRCDAALDVIDISAVRAAFTGSATTAPFGKIRGVVISDRANGNINSRNIVVQDATAGIVIRFAANHSLNLGDEVEVNVSGLELSEFSGLLQVNNVPLANATLLGLGTLPTPQTITISALLANFENYESELVKIVNAAITGGGATYSGTRTLADATGSIDLFTLGGASFSGTAYPTGTVNVTGIAGQGGAGSSKQISIRNTSDVETVILPGPLLEEDFEGTSGAISIPGWFNIAQVGTKQWQSATFESNRYAQFNPKAGGTPEDDNICWLITPSITLTTGNILTFRTKIRFSAPGHVPVRVFVATNFNGSNAGTANWTELTAVYSTVDDAWAASGNISLAAYNGQSVHLGFKYDGSGNDDDRSSAMQVDDVKVE